MKNIVAIYVSLILPITFAAGSNELHVQKAYEILPVILETCLKSSQNCELNSFENDLVLKIFEGLKYERETIAFESGKKYPGFFSIRGGTPRLAVTGNNIGDPIYFNSDIINSNDFNIFYSVLFLTHELGHHHGVKDDAERVLDQLGNKVMKFTKDFLLRHKNLGTNFDLFIFNPTQNLKLGRRRNYFPEAAIWVSFNNQILDLSKDLKNLRDCRDELEPISPNFFTAALGEISFEADSVDIAVSLEWYCPSMLNRILDSNSGKLTTKQKVIRLNVKPNEAGASLETTFITSSIDENSAHGLSNIFIEDMSTNTNQISSGGEWKVDLSIKIPSKFKIKKCSATISSNRFKNAKDGLFDFFFQNCDIIHDQSIILSQKFSSQTVHGVYHLKDIYLSIEPPEKEKLLTWDHDYDSNHPDGIYWLSYKSIENSNDLWQFAIDVILPEGYIVNECHAKVFGKSIVNGEEDLLDADSCSSVNFWDDSNSPRKVFTLTKNKNGQYKNLRMESLKIKYQLEDITHVLKPKIESRLVVNTGVLNKPLEMIDFNIESKDGIASFPMRSIDFGEVESWQWEFNFSRKFSPLIFKINYEYREQASYFKEKWYSILERNWSRENKNSFIIHMENEPGCIYYNYQEIALMDENLNTTKIPFSLMTRSFRTFLGLGENYICPEIF